jgi:hypothetical protein
MFETQYNDEMEAEVKRLEARQRARLLWREDDNGQRFLVGEYATELEAEEQMASLTKEQHKQTYWIEKLPN